MDRLKSTQLTVFLLSLFLSLQLSNIKANEILCSTTNEVLSAMTNATAGDTILIAPGTYISSEFETGNAGTNTSPIVMMSQDSTDQAILQGTSLGGGIVCEINHEYWVLKNLVFEYANKGIVVDNASYSVISGVTVSTTGQEGIHLINGSSHVQVLNARVFDCGLVIPDYGEAIYVGSDYLKWEKYDRDCNDNIIRGCILGPGVTAEHVDIKEGTERTIVENCIFYGAGMTGANGGGSFIDVKGDSAIIRDNIGFRQNNSKVVAAFETHKKTGLDGSEWGYGNMFTCNKVNLDVALPIIDAKNGAIAGGNVRYPESDRSLYYGNITEVEVTCIPTDCFGVEDGTATIDDCGVCSGGTTGIEPNSSCEQDCNGDWDGTAIIDTCGVCSGGNTGVEFNSSCEIDCNNEKDGTASIDDCGICSGGNTGNEPNSSCEQDCNGDWDGTASIDDCDECTGGNTGIEPNSTCAFDCHGDKDGDAAIDDCDVCSGGNTGIEVNACKTSAYNPIAISENMVYPNPASNYIEFSKYILKNFNQVNLYNVLGELVISSAQLANGIDLKELPSGLYFVQFMKSGESSKLVKLLKQ